MRPATYSNEEIIEAGLALQKEQKPANGFSIKRKLGGGRYQRIQQIWEEYLASQVAAEKTPAPELPIEVAERLSEAKQHLIASVESLVIELNHRAVQASERRVTEIIRNAGEQREQAERALADAAETVDAIEEQLDVERAQITELRNQLERAIGEKQSLAVELAQVKERLVAVENSAEASRNTAAARVKELEVQLKDQLRHAQLARDMEAEARGKLAAAEKQHAVDAETCINLRLDVTKANEALSIEKSKVSALETELKQFEGMRMELNQVREELSISKSKGSSQETQLQQLEKSLGEAQAALMDANAEAKVAILAAAEAKGREKSALEQVAALSKKTPRRPSASRVAKPAAEKAGKRDQTE